MAETAAPAPRGPSLFGLMFMVTLVLGGLYIGHNSMYLEDCYPDDEKTLDRLLMPDYWWDDSCKTPLGKLIGKVKGDEKEDSKEEVTEEDTEKTLERWKAQYEEDIGGELQEIKGKIEDAAVFGSLDYEETSKRLDEIEDELEEYGKRVQRRLDLLKEADKNQLKYTPSSDLLPRNIKIALNDKATKLIIDELEEPKKELVNRYGDIENNFRTADLEQKEVYLNDLEDLKKDVEEHNKEVERYDEIVEPDTVNYDDLLFDKNIDDLRSSIEDEIKTEKDSFGYKAKEAVSNNWGYAVLILLAALGGFLGRKKIKQAYRKWRGKESDEQEEDIDVDIKKLIAELNRLLGWSDKIVELIRNKAKLIKKEKGFDDLNLGKDEDIAKVFIKINKEKVKHNLHLIHKLHDLMIEMYELIKKDMNLTAESLALIGHIHTLVTTDHKSMDSIRNYYSTYDTDDHSHTFADINKVLAHKAAQKMHKGLLKGEDLYQISKRLKLDQDLDEILNNAKDSAHFLIYHLHQLFLELKYQNKWQVEQLRLIMRNADYLKAVQEGKLDITEKVRDAYKKDEDIVKGLYKSLQQEGILSSTYKQLKPKIEELIAKLKEQADIKSAVSDVKKPDPGKPFDLQAEMDSLKEKISQLDPHEMTQDRVDEIKELCKSVVQTIEGIPQERVKDTDKLQKLALFAKKVSEEVGGIYILLKRIRAYDSSEKLENDRADLNNRIEETTGILNNGNNGFTDACKKIIDEKIEELKSKSEEPKGPAQNTEGKDETEAYEWLRDLDLEAFKAYKEGNSDVGSKLEEYKAVLGKEISKTLTRYYRYYSEPETSRKKPDNLTYALEKIDELAGNLKPYNYVLAEELKFYLKEDKFAQNNLKLLRGITLKDLKYGIADKVYEDFKNKYEGLAKDGKLELQQLFEAMSGLSMVQQWVKNLEQYLKQGYRVFEESLARHIRASIASISWSDDENPDSMDLKHLFAYNPKLEKEINSYIDRLQQSGEEHDKEQENGTDIVKELSGDDKEMVDVLKELIERL